MTQSFRRIVLFAGATAVLLSAILVNLYVLDVIVFRDLRETLVKLLSVIVVSALAVVAVMLLSRMVRPR